MLDSISPAEASGIPILVDLGIGILVFELGYRVSLKWVIHNPWLLAMSAVPR
ncbi:MAG: hypothetical protein M3R58_06960 [Pseudomonadota bacterium]|nr:hypothetical protein [Pseudomonadota bacterium]